MRHFHLNREAEFCPTMNLDELWSLVPTEAQEQAAKDTSKAPVVDLTQHGVFKLLGRGRINRPIVVKTKFVSSIVGVFAILECRRSRRSRLLEVPASSLLKQMGWCNRYLVCLLNSG